MATKAVTSSRCSTCITSSGSCSNRGAVPVGFRLELNREYGVQRGLLVYSDIERGRNNLSAHAYLNPDPISARLRKCIRKRHAISGVVHGAVVGRAGGPAFRRDRALRRQRDGAERMQMHE